MTREAVAQFRCLCATTDLDLPVFDCYLGGSVLYCVCCAVWCNPHMYYTRSHCVWVWRCARTHLYYFSSPLHTQTPSDWHTVICVISFYHIFNETLYSWFGRSLVRSLTSACIHSFNYTHTHTQTQTCKERQIVFCRHYHRHRCSTNHSRAQLKSKSVHVTSNIVS